MQTVMLQFWLHRPHWFGCPLPYQLINRLISPSACRYGFNAGSTQCFYGCMPIAAQVAVNTTLATGQACMVYLLGGQRSDAPVCPCRCAVRGTPCQPAAPRLQRPTAPLTRLPPPLLPCLPSPVQAPAVSPASSWPCSMGTRETSGPSSTVRCAALCVCAHCRRRRRRRALWLLPAVPRRHVTLPRRSLPTTDQPAGILAGAVSITASCAMVQVWAPVGVPAWVSGSLTVSRRWAAATGWPYRRSDQSKSCSIGAHPKRRGPPLACCATPLDACSTQPPTAAQLCSCWYLNPT